MVTLVCDHLNTHHLSNLYKAFDAGTAARNAAKAGTRWQFTTADARVKLRALDPIPDIVR